MPILPFLAGWLVGIGVGAGGVGSVIGGMSFIGAGAGVGGTAGCSGAGGIGAGGAGVGVGVGLLLGSMCSIPPRTIAYNDGIIA